MILRPPTLIFAQDHRQGRPCALYPALLILVRGRACIAASSLETTKWVAPIAMPSARLSSLVDSTVTLQPMAVAIFNACRMGRVPLSSSELIDAS